MVRRSRRVALVTLAVVAVVGFPAIGVGEPDGATGRASASSQLTTDLLTTTELPTTTVETPTLTETSTTKTSTTTETATATTTSTTTEETPIPTTTVGSPTNETDDLTNSTDELTNGTDDVANRTDNLTSETGSTGNLTNSTDDLANATNATGELTGGATGSLLTVSAVDARGHFSMVSSSVTGTATGTLEGDVELASNPLDGLDSTDGSPPSDDGTRTENGTGTETGIGAGTSTESDTTTAGGGSSGADAGTSGESDRQPARDERGGPADAPELVVGFGALTVAALVPQLADGLALLANAGGVPTSSAAASSTFGVRRAVRSRLDRFWRFVAPFRYSRWDDSDPLDHEVREALYEAIDRSPGAYLSEIADRADVALSTARHHLDVLEDEGLVTTAKVRGKRRYYPDHAPDVELTAALEDEGTAEVLHALARLGASHGGRLADELERDASTVSHHLSRLEDAGLVEREREGRAVVNRLAPEARAVLRGDGEPGGESDGDSEPDGDTDGETPAVAD